MLKKIASPHTGIFNQGAEDHEEADEEVDVDGLHVGDLGQGRVHGVDEGGHRQHCRHPKTHLDIVKMVKVRLLIPLLVRHPCSARRKPKT